MSFKFLPIIFLFIFTSCAFLSQEEPAQIDDPDIIVSLQDTEPGEEEPENFSSAEEVFEPDFKEDPHDGRNHFINPKLINWKLVNKWINHYTKKDRARFIRFLANADQYYDVVTKTFKEHFIPTDIFYVGILESGYYSHSRSRVGATGPWQFMSGTAKFYGLKVNSEIDERKSFFKATAGAARYLTDLYNIFGAWDLALAAYNAGEGRIIGIIRRANTRNYHELSRRKKLPRDTIQYIPQVVAIKHIYENRKKYGLEENYAQNRLKYTDFKKMTLTHSFNAKKLAQAGGIAYQSEFLKFNPDIRKRELWASRRKPISVIVPNSMYERLKASPELIKTAYVRKAATYNSISAQEYRVRRGDTLSHIAQKYRLSISRLRELNNLRRRSRIFVGQKLIISRGNIKRKMASKSRYSGKTVKVRRGDSLYQIAKKYETSVHSLMRLNKLSRGMIYPNQKLRIP